MICYLLNIVFYYFITGLDIVLCPLLLSSYHRPNIVFRNAIKNTFMLIYFFCSDEEAGEGDEASPPKKMKKSPKKVLFEFWNHNQLIFTSLANCRENGRKVNLRKRPNVLKRIQTLPSEHVQRTCCGSWLEFRYLFIQFQ